MSRINRWSAVLRGNLYGLGIAWDNPPGGKPLDLDLQAVIVDESGHIVNAVYFNNSYAFKGAVQMAGDETCGNGSGLNEVIWVNIKKLPKAVSMIIFVVAAYGRGCLADADNGVVQICEGDLIHVMKGIPIENTTAQADMVAVMVRDLEGHWTMQELDEPAECGSHFLDILEPQIGDIIRKYIRGAPAVQTVTFEMAKGSVTDLPHSSHLKRVVVGIGGEMPPGCEWEADLDVSAVFFSKSGRFLGVVDRDTLEKFGFSHSGDGSAGTSLLDDEAIVATTAAIPDCVSQIFLLMTVKDCTFEQVASLYARVSDQDCRELAQFEFNGGIQEKGLVIARFFRSPAHRWGFQALGVFCQGSWREAQPQLRELFEKPTHISSGVQRTLTNTPKKSPRNRTKKKSHGPSTGTRKTREQDNSAPNVASMEVESRTDVQSAGRSPEEIGGKATSSELAVPEVAGGDVSQGSCDSLPLTRSTRSMKTRAWLPCSDVPIQCRTQQLATAPQELRRGGRRVTIKSIPKVTMPVDAVPDVNLETGDPDERAIEERAGREEAPPQRCSWVCGRN